MEIDLKNLRPGAEYPGGSVNSRKYSATEIADMEGQLIGHGQLQSLLVRTGPKKDGLFYVIAGNRRLAAMRALEKKKKLDKIPAFDPKKVPVIVRDDLDMGQMLSKSMIENTARVPLHPVDRYNTIAEMLARDMTVDAIALELMTTTRIVNQALELAKISVKARTAYLAGKISTAQAEALTVTTDHDQQDRVLKSIHEHTQPRQIRSQLVGDSETTAPMLAYVGEEDYLKAGGKLHKDLFGEGAGGAAPTVLNPDLLMKLASKKIEPKVKELEGEGWKWVSAAADLPTRYWTDWPRASGGKNCTPANKAKTGVVIEYRKDGTLHLTYAVLHSKDGYTLRDDAKKAKSKKEKPKPGGKPIVSAALMREMSQWLTEAAAGTLVMHSDDRLLHSLILAGANGAGFSKAVDIKVGGLHGKLLTSSRTYRENNKPFAVLFAQLMTMDAASIKVLLTELVARAFDFQVFSGDHLPVKDAAYGAVVNALNPLAMLAELSEQLKKNAERYFGGAGKRSNIEAVKEALGADTARQIAKGTGKTIAVFCAQNVPATGWLPEAMRTAHYKPPKPSGAPMKCRECGCTEDHACEGGCSWKEPGLCDNPDCLAADAKKKAKVKKAKPAPKKAKKKK